MSREFVTLDEVLAAAHAGLAPIAPELAGYVALAIADAASLDPRAIVARGVAISQEGRVALVEGAPKADPVEAERAVRGLLRALLASAGGTAPDRKSTRLNSSHRT